MSCIGTLKFCLPFSVHKTLLKAFLRTSSIKFLTVSQIKLLNACVVGPIKSRVYNKALLEYAVISQTRQRSHEQEKDLNQLAASLVSNLIKYNVFQSGCKETALLAAGLFRLENGMALHPSESYSTNNDTILDVYNRLASGAIDKNQLSEACGKMWSSTANGEQEEPIYRRLNISYVNALRRKFSNFFKHGQFSRSTAILGSGSY
jgi:prophage maintenance system killer protein